MERTSVAVDISVGFIDLPQVELINFRVEYVSPLSGRCLCREGYWINKTKDFSESLLVLWPLQTLLSGLSRTLLMKPSLGKGAWRPWTARTQRRTQGVQSGVRERDMRIQTLIFSDFCKDHRDKTEVPDPLTVEDLISYKLNNTPKFARLIIQYSYILCN